MARGWLRARSRSYGRRAVRRDYWRWICDNEPALQNVRSTRIAPGVSFLVILDATNATDNMVRCTLESCMRQDQPWSLTLMTDSEALAGLAVAAADDRVTVVLTENGAGFDAACDAAVQQTPADLVVFPTAGDVLADDALTVIAQAFTCHSEVDVLYSDHDEHDSRGRRVAPFFKPSWSPEMLLRGHYLLQIIAYRTGLLRENGAMRAGYGTAATYELALRSTFAARRVIHVPHVLYHFAPSTRRTRIRHTAQFAMLGRRALCEHLARLSVAGDVEVDTRSSSQGQVRFRLRPSLRDEPLVSVVMPFRDRPDLLRRCVRDLLDRTDWPRLELVLVDNGSTRPETHRLLDSLSRDSRVSIVRDEGGFNWSRISNLGAAQASGTYLIFMNNDIGVIDAQWLRLLVEQAQRTRIGLVGPLLLTPCGRVQHAGVSIGTGRSGNASHPLLGLRPWQTTPFGDALWLRNVSAVTGACAMISNDVFASVGGFDENFEVCFGDVELGVRLSALGYRNIVVPWSALYHFESSTRARRVSAQDIAHASQTFASTLTSGDPYYNPNLSRISPACSLA